MHKNIDKIKDLESPPKVIKNLFSNTDIEKFLKLYQDLPVTVHNKNQNVIKKRWLKNFNDELENLFIEKVKKESYNPIGLHVDAGFNLNEIIFKQTLIPLTPKGSTVIFKNKFYGSSTNFTIDENELKVKDLKYGQNFRSSEHLKMYKQKPFNKEDHEKYLKHEKIENLSGLEIDLVYEWELGSMLVFDRTRLHCSSSSIEGKKIGLTTFTKK